MSGRVSGRLIRRARQGKERMRSAALHSTTAADADPVEETPLRLFDVMFTGDSASHQQHQLLEF